MQPRPLDEIEDVDSLGMYEQADALIKKIKKEFVL